MTRGLSILAAKGVAAAATCVASLVACSSGRSPAGPLADAGIDAARDAGAPPPADFRAASDAALQTLVDVFYDAGNWRLCVPKPCGILAISDFDWGADSLTGTLYLRWSLENDTSIVSMMQALDANGPSYQTCRATNCPTWSDVPLWDSIAASHEYLVTRSAGALTRARGAFAYVDTATEFALGACPKIDYQIPVAGGNPVFGANVGIKTLETDSNYVKAALLLHQLTGDASYLDKAVAKYASIRQYFLDPMVPLYTVYVVDDGQSCAQVPRRFYGSVNGNMIWSGIGLAAVTGQTSYLDDAIGTASAVAQDLSDANGVYADLQTDDDVVEPLVEGMYRLASESDQSFASAWLLTNARAMAGARAANGAYGRFFDGPPPPGQMTEWQVNGGLALAIAAGALSPSGSASDNADAWQGAMSIADNLTALPASIAFRGRAIAVFGTLGEQSYELGQASVFVDGVETFDQTGIHQDESNALGPVPSSILFAWRWPTSGPHTLEFRGQTPDPKDGASFLHVQAYSFLP
jgi:hypothetical protein